jgi:hypothetical protein
MRSLDRRGCDGDLRIRRYRARGSQEVVVAWRPAQRAALRSRARCGPGPGGAGIPGTEIFGPVAPVVRFTAEADAVRWATTPSSGWSATCIPGT